MARVLVLEDATPNLIKALPRLFILKEVSAITWAIMRETKFNWWRGIVVLVMVPFVIAIAAWQYRNKVITAMQDDDVIAVHMPIFSKWNWKYARFIGPLYGCKPPYETEVKM